MTIAAEIQMSHYLWKHCYQLKDNLTFKIHKIQNKTEIQYLV